MLSKIAQEIKLTLNNYSKDDQIIFQNRIIPIKLENFKTIQNSVVSKKIAFVDGGQAEIISTGNFCLSFVRIFAQIFEKNKKLDSYKNEFYLFTKAKWFKNDLFYESKIFPLGEKIIDEEDLLISSNDSSLRTGIERAPIGKITNMARRFAELSLASKLEVDYIILDGTLQATFLNEERYLSKLKNNVSGLAKTSSLFTTSGNNPTVLLSSIAPDGCWNYFLEGNTYFLKLNLRSKHVFRFEGNKEVLSYLMENSNDALFLGYPYGLIFVDKMARVSNMEKKQLSLSFLLRNDNKELMSYLSSTNAHQILDNLEY